MKILVTGAAGFIGFHTAEKLIHEGHEVVGLDNLNAYYQVSLKEDRLKKLGLTPFDSQSSIHNVLSFKKIDLSDEIAISHLFELEKFDVVIHLAAQAGVRYSIENPKAYIKSNSEGFLNILEGCRHNKVKHLIYASSSSVYGLNKEVPFKVENAVDHPVSLYAATKRANELMAHTYSHLYGLPTTGLRFFTVYGPWGRPDMAPFLFTEAILKDNPINVFNDGKMQRDFTYIDDIVEAQCKLLGVLPEPIDHSNLPNRSTAPYRIFNIGNSNPVHLMDFIEIVEKHTGRKANKKMMPIQPGDVEKTFADVEDLYSIIKFRPSTTLDSGIGKFVNWYRDYYSL
jgi:UDP-glucuronate 4-epimerase